MQKFKFLPPSIHPTSYKDKEGMQVDKWFIRYAITYEDLPTKYRKEYGGSYKRKINVIENHKDKIDNAEMLLGRVLRDLESGIDPKYREVELVEKVKQEIIAAEKYKVEYIYNLWFTAKNYVNPIPSKALSAEKYNGFWLNQFIPYLKTLGKDVDIRKVTHEDIDSWILENYNSGNWGVTTIDNKIGFLSGVFKYAFKKRFILENPMTYVSRITENKIVVKNGEAMLKVKKDARFNILTILEQEIIYKYFDLKNETIAKTLGFAFIRFSEIFRLRLQHLNTEKWQFEIPADIAKGQRDGSTHIVKVYPKLQVILEQYLDEYFGDDRESDYFLFYQNNNKRLASSYSILQHFFNKMKKEVRENENIVIKKTPYCFKHTGAKRFIDQNKAKSKTSYQIIEAIKKLMRHKDFATSQKYIYTDLGMNLDENDDFTFD